MSARRSAIAVMKSRLESITLANGYSTDAGKKLFIGESPRLGPDDVSAVIFVDIMRDLLVYQGEDVTVRLPVSVEILANAAGEVPWDVIEATLEDVKKAVEQDHDLDGTLLPLGLERVSTEPLDRESEFVGVKVEYNLLYKEGWGAP